MAVDIELCCSLIQAKLRTLSPQYLSNVPDVDGYFTALSDALCPYAMTWPGPGSWYQKGGGYKTDIRDFAVYVFVESLAQKDIPTRTQQGIRALQAVRNLFLIPANIPLDSGASTGYQITVESREGNAQSDTGLTAGLPFSGAPWFGFTLRLSVRTMWIS